jgi:hypothetical protein
MISIYGQWGGHGPVGAVEPGRRNIRVLEVTLHELRKCKWRMCSCRSRFKTCVFELFGLLSNNVKIKINRTVIFVNFFMGVKICLSHWGRNIGWGCSRIGCWGGYLFLRGDEVTGEWRRLHNDELYDLYSWYIWSALGDWWSTWMRHDSTPGRWSRTLLLALRKREQRQKMYWG